jgi:hypothetical protein
MERGRAGSEGGKDIVLEGVFFKKIYNYLWLYYSLKHPE